MKAVSDSSMLLRLWQGGFMKMGSKYDLGNVWWVPHNKVRFPEKIWKGYDRPIITVLDYSIHSAMIIPGTSGSPGKKCTVKIEHDDFPSLKKTGYFMTRFVQPVIKKHFKSYQGLLPANLRDEIADKVRGKLLKEYGIVLQ